MKELIDSITQKHIKIGIEINSPATLTETIEFERQIGFNLPLEFKDFYLSTNGFSCEEDIFNMNSISDIIQDFRRSGDNWFYFSEYMHYSDMWGIRLTSSGQYEIFNGSYPNKPMTSSLIEFLKKFLKGNVFDNGGLYQWHVKNLE